VCKKILNVDRMRNGRVRGAVHSRRRRAIIYRTGELRYRWEGERVRKAGCQKTPLGKAEQWITKTARGMDKLREEVKRREKQGPRNAPGKEVETITRG